MDASGSSVEEDEDGSSDEVSSLCVCQTQQDGAKLDACHMLITRKMSHYVEDSSLEGSVPVGVYQCYCEGSFKGGEGIAHQ